MIYEWFPLGIISMDNKYFIFHAIKNNMKKDWGASFGGPFTKARSAL